MNESAICLGSTDVLVGVLTEPDEPVDPRVPVLVLLSSGIVHRSGPSRLYVEIARRLAARGYPSFRLDLAGIGDSDNRTQNLTDDESNERDVRLAMDFVTSKLGTRRFLLGGLCSGADISHQVALSDDRVVGMIALDAIAYPRLGYYVRRVGRWIRNPRYVYRQAIRLARSCKLGRVLFGSSSEDSKTVPFRLFERDLPPQEAVAAEIQSLVNRGLQALYIFAGGCPWYNSAGQFLDNFPNLRGNTQVEVEYFPQADHTYLLVADRDGLIARIENWVASRFPHGTASTFGTELVFSSLIESGHDRSVQSVVQPLLCHRSVTRS